MTCDKGYQGECCCMCEHQITLMCHPANERIGKGSIAYQFGAWACSVDLQRITKERTAVFMDRKHGICELFQLRK
jgi:hypothetical protein